MYFKLLALSEDIVENNVGKGKTVVYENFVTLLALFSKVLFMRVVKKPVHLVTNQHIEHRIKPADISLEF